MSSLEMSDEPTLSSTSNHTYYCKLTHYCCNCFYYLLSILYRIALRDLLRIRFCFMFRTAERIFRSAEHTFNSGERTFRSAEHKTNTVQRYIKYDYHVSFSPVILILLLLFIRHRLIGVTIKRYP